MTRNNYLAVNVLCPFFKDYERRTIRCEGFLANGSEITTFLTEKEMTTYLEQKCSDDYRNCPKYRTIMEEKYKEEE